MRSSQGNAGVAVIGAGLGGLTVALILQRLGYQVVVIEKNRVPGGLVRGFERQGIHCPVGVHYVGALGEGEPVDRMLAFMGVRPALSWERMGREGVVDRYVFDDFTFDLPEGIDEFGARLRDAFPREAAAVSACIGHLAQWAPKVLALDFLHGDGAGALAPEDFETLDQRMRRLGCSAPMRRLLAMPCFWMGLTALDCPVVYHHMALLTYLLSSWRPRLTGGEMADVFAGRIREQGGTLLLGDPAEEILADSGRVSGVRLRSGIRISAASVIAAVHPKVLLPMLPVGALQSAQSRRIRLLRDTDGIFGAHFAVDGLRHPPQSHNTFRIRSGGPRQDDDVLFGQLRPTPFDGTTLLLLLTGCPGEDWQSWIHSETGRRGEGYVEAKKAMAWELLRQAEGMFGPFARVRYLDSFTSLTLRDWVGSPGGSAYGIRRSCEQMLPAARMHRFPVRGLFLAGQNALAPGFYGTLMGSFHAVRMLIGPERYRREVALSPEFRNG